MSTFFTEAAATRAGWTLHVDGEDGTAATKDGRAISVTSQTPRFALLVSIAEAEGQGFAAGYGGEQVITPELVKAVTGETYSVAPPVQYTPPPALSDDQAVAVAAAVAAALASVLPLAAADATTAQRAAATDAAEQAALDSMSQPVQVDPATTAERGTP